VCLHEFGHAWAAYRGGDYTVREKGYLTLNPIHYTHPVYSLLMPVVFMMLGGIGLRAWANTILGAFYTRTLRVTEEQQLIQHGPYRLLRHPGYTGSILLWIGAGLASMNRVSAATIAIVTASAYIYRIKAEEFMLEQTFGSAYRAYQRGTWRLFPLIY